MTPMDLEVVAPGAIESQERAAIDMQIATARRYPRELKLIKAKMLAMATLDRETAEACFYTLKRKDTDGSTKRIQGPSVRLAEVAVCCYGNIRAATRVIGNDGQKITAQGVCQDLENNVVVSMETQRRITTKAGKTFGDDMQIVAANAASAIAFRNSVFKVVPLALVKPIYEQCRLVAVGDAKSITDRWHRAVDQFGKMGVSAEQMMRFVEKKTLDEITTEDLADLIGVFNAIRDGEQTIDEVFNQQTPGTADDAAKAAEDKLAGLRQPKPDAAGFISNEEAARLLDTADVMNVGQPGLKKVIAEYGYTSDLMKITKTDYAKIMHDLEHGRVSSAQAPTGQSESPAASGSPAGDAPDLGKGKVRK